MGGNLSNEDFFEHKISKLILEHSMKDWTSFTNADVIIVGAGPAGLTAAKYLADKGFKTIIFERKLTFGGGLGGGGMLFHKVVVEKEAIEVLKDFNVRYYETEERDLYVVDSFELMAKLATGAIDSGAKVIHGVTVEDVIFRENPLRITGVAIQWTSVIMSGLHVDPLFIQAKAVVDATGHDAEVLSIVSRKVPKAGINLIGEKSAMARYAEKAVVEKTGRVLPGLYVAGMAVATLYGLPRMGPIFGGMLLSGKKVAEIICSDIR